jgi:hypothetical protein
MRVSLIGMAGSGKSYWSMRLAEHGFRRFCCDDLIAAKLAPELKRPDGTAMQVSQWMGFPYDPHYKERESKYMACELEVLTQILGYLESREKHPEENIVVDTSGSVIYAGESILRKLGRYTTIAYLLTPPELQGQLLQAYISNPHPMVWGDVFRRDPGETNRQALARSYPRLVAARQRLYERYAAVTIGYYRRMEEGFGVREFLSAVNAQGI